MGHEGQKHGGGMEGLSLLSRNELTEGMNYAKEWGEPATGESW